MSSALISPCFRRCAFLLTRSPPLELLRSAILNFCRVHHSAVATFCTSRVLCDGAIGV